MRKLTYLVVAILAISCTPKEQKEELTFADMQGTWWVNMGSEYSYYREFQINDTTITDRNFFTYNVLDYEIEGDTIRFISNDFIGNTEFKDQSKSQYIIINKDSMLFSSKWSRDTLIRIKDSYLPLDTMTSENYNYNRYSMLMLIRQDKYEYGKEFGTDTIDDVDIPIHVFKEGDTLAVNNQDIIHRMYRQDGKLIYEKLLFDISDYIEGETFWYEQLKGREDELAKVLIREELPEI